MMSNRNFGEGNKAADRRYRKSVRETVERTTADERADKARGLKGEDKEDARNAEEKAKSKARS
jgi:hypothetical protein